MSARLLALLVHAVTLVLAASALLLLFARFWLPLRLVLGLLLLAVVWQVRPRSVPLPRGTALTAAEAPALFSWVGDLAAPAGASAPTRVLFTTTTSATCGYAAGGTYLTVGLPLWSAASAEERAALVAEQLGQLSSGTAAVQPVVASAMRTLQEWQYLFHPGNEEARRRLETEQTFFVNTAGNLGSYTDLVLPVILLPLFLVVSGLRSVLVRLVADDGARAAARGREVAAQIAPGGAVSLTQLRGRAEQLLVQMETASRRDPKAALWDVGSAQRRATPSDEAIDSELRPLLRRTEQDLRDAARA